MPSLASADWLILLIYCFFVLTAGFSLRPFMTGSREFLQAGRALPAWLCGLAMAGAGLGSQELLGMGAAGARFGLASLSLIALGSIPAMLFAGLYLMPVYYGSNSGPGAAGTSARSIPEYLGLRFDQKDTRAERLPFSWRWRSFSAGISLYVMARVLTALQIFDQVSNRWHLPEQGVLILAIALPALLVLAYVLLGGLGAAMYNQVLQFCVVVAGLLPVGRAWPEEDRRMEWVEECGSGRFFARVEWRSKRGRAFDGNWRGWTWARRGTRSGRRNVVHRLQTRCKRPWLRRMWSRPEDPRLLLRRYGCLSRF